MAIPVMDKKYRSMADMISSSSSSSSSSELALGTHAQLASGDIPKQEGCRPGLCGSEAACNPKPDNTYECVCPHDGSPPTPDLKCPNRITVTATPRPIIIFIPPREANATATNTTSTQQQAVREERLPVMNGVLIGMLGVALVAVVISVALCLIKRKEMSRCISRNGKHRKSSCSPSPLSLSKGLLVPNRYTPNPQYSACATPDAMLVPLLSRENVHFLQEIGEGCFGKVYKGELHRESEVEVVAVKVLKDTATREAEEDLMREVDIMSAFRHPNILSLVGVVPRDSGGNSPWMVFEYMPHGDLAEVLRSNSRALWKPLSGLAPLTKRSLLSVALQVAAGMEYLAGQRFVHRDLACRNCLVGAGLTVKIADFGMSRDVYTCDYYKIGGSRLLPVRWMSPESVMYGRFTLESDVWSYGVVLWEIYSLGKQPYYGHTNEEVVKLILQGIMLIPPEDCPTVICELMRSCWKTEPRDRIRFTEVYSRLRKAFEDEEASNPSPTPPPLPSTPPPPLTQEEHLPRPPGAFPSACLSERAELLDSENYLLPQVPSPDPRREYLQPLPD